MKKLLLTIFIFSSLLFGQLGNISSGLPFLTFEPSAAANGSAGIPSLSIDDPSAISKNVSLLGIQSLTTRFGISAFLNGVNPYQVSNWNPQYRNHSFILGARVNELYGDGSLSNVSVGFAFSRLYFNLGEFIVTTDKSPDEIMRYNAYEYSNNFSLAIGIDAIAKVGIGITLKDITSHLGLIGMLENSKINENFFAYDLGIATVLPIFDLYNKIHETNFEIIPNIFPRFDIALLYSLNNIGNKVTYTDPAQADPYPRTAEVGYSITLGSDYIKKNNFETELFSFSFGRHTSDFLVYRYPNGNWDYQTGPLGDISVINNLIIGQPDLKTTIYKGHSFTILELVTIRKGASYSTGFALSSNGYSIHIVPFLNIFKIFEENEIVNFVTKKFEISYNYSETQPHEGFIWDHNLKYSSITFTFK